MQTRLSEYMKVAKPVGTRKGLRVVVHVSATLGKLRIQSEPADSCHSHRRAELHGFPCGDRQPT
jgi:hypothetical protein